MHLGCNHTLRISVRVLNTILTLMLAAPGLFAQNNPPAARLRSLNNQLLGIYGRLLSSPAGEAIALRSQAAQLIQERAALLGDMIETDTAQALGLAFSQDLLANLAAAFPDSASRLESTGTWEGQLDWVVAMKPDLVYNIFFGSAGRSVSEYWREASYGVTSASGAVFGWYTLDAVYTCDQYSSIKTAAIKAADADVNFTQYSRLAIIFPSSSCSWAGLAEVGCGTISSADGSVTGSTAWMLSTYFSSTDNGVKLANHELGHNLGLHHSSSRDFGTEALGAPGTAGTLSEYGDVFSSMGSWNLGHYPAPHKKMLKWMTEGATIRTVTSNGSFSVQPFELSAGTLQALKIQRGAGSSNWVWLEYRQLVGNYDSTLGLQISSGATIHYEDSTTGIHSHLLDYTPETRSWSDPALASTKSWTDPYTNLSISITGATSSSLNVDVTYGPIPCVTAAPAVTISPSNPSVYAGNNVIYTVSVANNDSAGCTARSFDLSSSLPSSWPNSLSQSLLTLSPPSSASVSMTKSVPTGTAPATYSVDASAQNAGDTGTGFANITVVPTPPPITISLSVANPTYPQNSTVPITATVIQNASPVSGASVTFTLTRPDTSTTTKAIATGSNGQATWSYKINPKAIKGTYTVTAQTTYGSQSATASAITFTVQ